MAILEDIKNNFGAWLGSTIAPYINDAMGRRGSVLARYYTGEHDPQLKNKINKDGTIIDDNIIQNFTGLAVNRSVSRLFRGGLEWELPEGSDEQKEYLDAVWTLNKKAITLFQVGLTGSYYGTPYIKIRPDALIDPYTEQLFPSLIVLDPEIVRIKTDPQDMTEVTEYRVEYTCKEERNGRTSDVWHLEVTRHSRDGDCQNESGDALETPDTWQIEEYERVDSAPIQLVRVEEFQYNFPPIIHCKNLPSIKTPYGMSDIDDVINVQNKSNFVISNEGKIVKHHASQRPVVLGATADQIKAVDDSPDAMIAISNKDASVTLLQGQSDLTSSRDLADSLRRSIFDIAREVDLSSMADKLGALTNFGLQVLWLDATDKNETKRQLYGDMILELNRRLLVMKGYEKEKSNPGALRWGSAMPTDLVEEITLDEKALGLGVVDKETVAKRWQLRYGVDWETIKTNLAAQKEDDNQGNANIGADILRRFNQGR